MAVDVIYADASLPPAYDPGWDTVVRGRPLLLLVPLLPLLSSIAVAQAAVWLRISTAIARSVSFACGTWVGFLLPVVLLFIAFATGVTQLPVPGSEGEPQAYQMDGR